MKGDDILHKIMKLDLLHPGLVHFVSFFLSLFHEFVRLLNWLLGLLNALNLGLDGFAQLSIKFYLLFLVLLDD